MSAIVEVQPEVARRPIPRATEHRSSRWKTVGKIIAGGSVMLAMACAPTSGELTPAQLEAYAASQRIPTVTAVPTREPTQTPVLPAREAFDPRLAGGGAPEPTATIPVTLPDGTKATVIIPPPTPTSIPEREHWPTDPRIGMPEDLRRIQPEPTLPPKPPQSLSDRAPQELKQLYADADNMAKYYRATGYDPAFVSELFKRSLKNNLAHCDDPSMYVSTNPARYFGCLQNVWSQLGAPNLMYENPPALDFAKRFITFVKATLGPSFKPEDWLIGDGKTYKLN